jgi:hypothetical protein
MQVVSDLVPVLITFAPDLRLVNRGFYAAYLDNIDLVVRCNYKRHRVEYGKTLARCQENSMPRFLHKCISVRGEYKENFGSFEKHKKIDLRRFIELRMRRNCELNAWHFRVTTPDYELFIAEGLAFRVKLRYEYVSKDRVEACGKVGKCSRRPSTRPRDAQAAGTSKWFDKIAVAIKRNYGDVLKFMRGFSDNFDSLPFYHLSLIHI